MSSLNPLTPGSGGYVDRAARIQALSQLAKTGRPRNGTDPAFYVVPEQSGNLPQQAAVYADRATVQEMEDAQVLAPNTPVATAFDPRGGASGRQHRVRVITKHLFDQEQRAANTVLGDIGAQQAKVEGLKKEAHEAGVAGQKYWRRYQFLKKGWVKYPLAVAALAAVCVGFTGAIPALAVHLIFGAYVTRHATKLFSKAAVYSEFGIVRNANRDPNTGAAKAPNHGRYGRAVEKVNTLSQQVQSASGDEYSKVRSRISRRGHEVEIDLAPGQTIGDAIRTQMLDDVAELAVEGATISNGISARRITDQEAMDLGDAIRASLGSNLDAALQQLATGAVGIPGVGNFSLSAETAQAANVVRTARGVAGPGLGIGPVVGTPTPAPFTPAPPAPYSPAPPAPYSPAPPAPYSPAPPAPYSPAPPAPYSPAPPAPYPPVPAPRATPPAPGRPAPTPAPTPAPPGNPAAGYARRGAAATPTPGRPAPYTPAPPTPAPPAPGRPAPGRPAPTPAPPGNPAAGYARRGAAATPAPGRPAPAPYTPAPPAPTPAPDRSATEGRHSGAGRHSVGDGAGSAATPSPARTGGRHSADALGDPAVRPGAAGDTSGVAPVSPARHRARPAGGPDSLA